MDYVCDGCIITVFFSDSKEPEGSVKKENYNSVPKDDSFQGICLNAV